MSNTQALKHSHLKRVEGAAVIKPHGDLTRVSGRAVGTVGP